MIRNHPGRQFSAFQRHQHSAAGKGIDERGRITDGEQSTRGCDGMPAESFERNSEPWCACLSMLEGVSCPPVLADDCSHHVLGLGSRLAHRARRGDEAKIASTIFHAAKAAVAAAIKINLTSTRRDLSAFQMCFESNQRCALWFRRLPGFSDPTGEGPGSSGGIDRNWRSIADFVSGVLDHHSFYTIVFRYQIDDVRI